MGRTYFAVPTLYTIGEEFDTFDAAAAHARSTIVDFDFGGTSRAFVDERVKDESGDRPVKRTEVFRKGDEPSAADSDPLYHMISDAHHAILHPDAFTDPARNNPEPIINNIIGRLQRALIAHQRGDKITASRMFDPRYEVRS